VPEAVLAQGPALLACGAGACAYLADGGGVTGDRGVAGGCGVAAVAAPIGAEGRWRTLLKLLPGAQAFAAAAAAVAIAAAVDAAAAGVDAAAAAAAARVAAVAGGEAVGAVARPGVASIGS
jgi:hypothetical protein